MARTSFLTAVLAAICFSTIVFAQFLPTSRTASSCLFPATQSVDGCLGAPLSNTYAPQYANFFTSTTTHGALQSGQSYSGFGSASSHPPQWNVAGVDYPVGINSGVTLLDPAVSQPTGCSWVSSRNELSCNAAGSLTINGYDFSTHGGVFLAVGSAVTGLVTITNCNFVLGSTNFSAYFLISVTGGNGLIFENNFVNGNGSTVATTYTTMLYYSGNGNITLMYNYFLNTPSRFIENDPTGTNKVTFEYNYCEGITFVSGDAHGEVFLSVQLDNIYTMTGSISGTTLTVNTITGTLLPGMQLGGAGVTDNTIVQPYGTSGTNGTGGTGTYAVSISQNVSLESLQAASTLGYASNVTINYNAFLQPSTALSNGTTAAFAPFEGILGTNTVASFQLENNVIVFNKSGGNGGTNSAGTAILVLPSSGGSGVSLYSMTYSSVLLENNYVDPTGADQCYNVSSGSFTSYTHSGDTNLLNASFVSDFTTATCYGHY